MKEILVIVDKKRKSKYFSKAAEDVEKGLLNKLIDGLQLKQRCLSSRLVCAFSSESDVAWLPEFKSSIKSMLEVKIFFPF